jgi:hypothetical protein
MAEKENWLWKFVLELRPHAAWWILERVAGAAVLGAAYVLLQKARHLAWDWWVFGGIFVASSALLIVLSKRRSHINGGIPSSESQSLPKPSSLAVHQAKKLVIHSAFYGTGPFDDVSVTDQLITATRDALVVAVNNNLVDHDPAPMKLKRLQVEYSYGGPSVLKASRTEGGRLVLPEDSEIQRLAAEVATQQLEIAKGNAFPRALDLTAKALETALGASKSLGSLPVYRQELEVQLLNVIVGTAIATNATVFVRLKLWAKTDLNIVSASVRITTNGETFETSGLQDLSGWLLVEEVVDKYKIKNHKDTNLETLSLVREIESGMFREGHHQPKWVGCELPVHFLEYDDIQAVTITIRDKLGVAKKDTYREWPNTTDRVIDADFRT